MGLFNLMRQSRFANLAIMSAVLLPLLGIAFFAGSFAQKHCMFPFCRGFLQNTAALLDEDDPAAFGDGLLELGTDTLSTNLYEITVASISLTGENVERDRVWFPKHGGREGGITTVGNDVLVASRHGKLMHIDEDLNYEVLPIEVPTPYDSFEESLSGSEYAEETENENPISKEFFGVKDLYADERPNGQLLLVASYNNWDPEERCYTLKVSQIELERSTGTFTGNGSWEDVYETEPCLGFKDRSEPFAGHESGGRIARLSGSELLLSVGDLEHNAYDGPDLPQDSTNHYGKTIRIDLEEGNADIYSMGHRNPQGLHVDEEGNVWLTEHGPKGGDELNLIEEGMNYGWPNVTYGTMYDQYRWPPAERDGSHEGYTHPIYSWIPSIGISQVISVTQSLFDLWQGDLLIGSLPEGSLHRTRVHDGRVIFTEPINLGWRVRDLAERADGVLVIKTDRNTLLLLRPTDATEV